MERRQRRAIAGPAIARDDRAARARRPLAINRCNRRNHHRRPEEDDNRSEDERYQHPLVQGQPVRCREFVTASASRSQSTCWDRNRQACGRKTCRDRSRGHLLRPPLPANQGLKTTIANKLRSGVLAPIYWIMFTSHSRLSSKRQPPLGPGEIPRGRWAAVCAWPGRVGRRGLPSCLRSRPGVRLSEGLLRCRRHREPDQGATPSPESSSRRTDRFGCRAPARRPTRPHRRDASARYWIRP